METTTEIRFLDIYFNIDLAVRKHKAGNGGCRQDRTCIDGKYIKNKKQNHSLCPHPCTSRLQNSSLLPL
jgi:hypothetical protein